MSRSYKCHPMAVTPTHGIILMIYSSRFGSNESVILATNTSSLPCREIGVHISQKARFAGLHFFNPVAVMKLVEIVRVDDGTDEPTYQALVQFVKDLGKVGVTCGDTPGFIVNRLLIPYMWANDDTTILFQLIPFTTGSKQFRCWNGVTPRLKILTLPWNWAPGIRWDLLSLWTTLVWTQPSLSAKPLSTRGLERGLWMNQSSWTKWYPMANWDANPVRDFMITLKFNESWIKWKPIFYIWIINQIGYNSNWMVANFYSNRLQWQMYQYWDNF